MPGYPDQGSMSELLLAMKEKAQQDQTYLTYVTLYRIKLGGWWWAPWDRYGLYFIPVGSPETKEGERAGVDVKYATHIVDIECVVPYQNPDIEDAIVGRQSAHKGLAEFVEDVLDYYENNLLGLTGLEHGVPPTIQAPEGAYQDIQVDESIYIKVASLRYEARTRPFSRTSN